MLMRERRPAPSILPLLPAPAPLPSLTSAFATRRGIFGTLDLNEPHMPPSSPWQTIGALARRVADRLDPQPTSLPSA